MENSMQDPHQMQNTFKQRLELQTILEMRNLMMIIIMFFQTAKCIFFFFGYHVEQTVVHNWGAGGIQILTFLIYLCKLFL